ncbi:dienelactone hydrolase family protein [Falsiroseomonas ponticola]|uniref:dienelactone hydrolase family protein n=1 Tax=Falsiroseomonas ponticola TaxID=2786951 RepID=UPI0019338B67|nr:dienelactone hydrolase family protein [Roseomonas ponticola]
MMIELTAADGHRFAAYKAGPADAKKALVVVQEIFGVNRHMRRICDDFAKQGYAVIAPALFDRVERGVELGYTGDDVARGRDLRAKVPADGPMLDVEAAAAALPAGAAKGIVGYCWGGTVAWWGATRSTSFKAACGWYGGGIAGTKDEKPSCPVELHFGSLDASIPMSDVEAIRAAQPGIAIFVYEGAGHGFGCEDRASYKADDAAVAEKRTLDFFAKHLG